MKAPDRTKKIVLLALVCALLGTATRYFLLDSPLRVLFWSEKWMKPILGFFGTTWTEYANSTNVDQWLMLTSQVVATLLVMAAAWIIFRRQISFFLTLILSMSFALFSLLSWKDHFYHLPFLMEMAIVSCTPFFLYANALMLRTQLIAKLAIASTFVGHGLYALNILELPGDFVQMVMNITSVDEDAARLILKGVGIVDLLAGAMLFLPVRYLVRIALIYCCIWGFVTAFARIAGHYHAEFGIHTLDGYWHETVIRLPNGLIPLWLYRTIRMQKSQNQL